ncbi:hypothetical protein LCGC14_2246320 [marine sediment metagenome]|uniref:Uncharacterized protein n=1 Tax=marine sediment metagenome TaxID=412755 RepID=A0A0F9DRG7_9ZZZZ
MDAQCENCGKKICDDNSMFIVSIEDMGHLRDSIDGMIIPNLLDYILDASVWFCSRYCTINYLTGKENGVI